MKYDNTADLQINIEVAILRFPEAVRVIIENDTTGKLQCTVKGLDFYYSDYDPCNNWGHGGPIIVDSDINIISPETSGTVPNWEANRWYPGPRQGCEAQDENPLRAAMECFLMMQEPK